MKSYSCVSILLLITLTFLSLACHSDADKLPWDTKKTVDIFTEAQLIEAKLNTITNRNTKDSLSEAYYQSLFEKYATNMEEFEQVFDYYSKRPEKMEDLYADIITQLTLLQSQEIKKLPSEKKQKRQ